MARQQQPSQFHQSRLGNHIMGASHTERQPQPVREGIHVDGFVGADSGALVINHHERQDLTPNYAQQQAGPKDGVPIFHIVDNSIPQVSMQATERGTTVEHRGQVVESPSRDDARRGSQSRRARRIQDHINACTQALRTTAETGETPRYPMVADPLDSTEVGNLPEGDLYPGYRHDYRPSSV